MEHPRKRLFICTDNYYLFYGVFCSLSEKEEYNINWLKSIDSLLELSSLNLHINDTVILLTEINMTDYQMLIRMYQQECKALITSNAETPLFMPIFNFLILNCDFKLNELICAINTRHYIRNGESYPKITRQERYILSYMLKGYTVSAISEFLKISEKTIYNHQKNALRKLGVRKMPGLFRLPRNLLDNLLSITM